MPVFEWKDNLAIGISDIDSQHRTLIKRINDLAEAVEKQKGKDKICNMLKFMENYAELHFSTEEDCMAKNNYSGLKQQKEEHDKFRTVVKKLSKELEAEGVSEGFAASVQRYLIDWLILHIKETDLKFSEFLQETDK